jgi:glycosyltransferase involved in cell wall biosynthesis
MLMLELAKNMPHREFLIVGRWQHHVIDEDTKKIEKGLNQLKNVTRLPNTSDMRALYSQAHCLLMPSVAKEAFGRVAAEAQISGIPVLASSQGALPDTVGNGGVVINLSAPLNHWIDAINSMFDDPLFYRNLSQNALEQANKPSRQIEYVDKQVYQLLKDLVNEGQ